MRAAIDALPEKYRTMITLFHLQNKQYNEIAQVLNLPTGTVKTHLFRAKDLLRKALDDTRRANDCCAARRKERIMTDDELELALFALPLEEPPVDVQVGVWFVVWISPFLCGRPAAQ